ncbi:Uncharacterised protein [Mycobacteroides abscessus subsp. abscessus]|nr:Uncharacterised protein [Mycobacteroides abscessus subsp. abscessus]
MTVFSTLSTVIFRSSAWPSRSSSVIFTQDSALSTSRFLAPSAA